VVVAAWYVVLACFPNECMCRVAARVPRQLQHACKACARVWIECFVFPITSTGDDGHGRGYQKTTDQFHTHTQKHGSRSRILPGRLKTTGSTWNPSVSPLAEDNYTTTATTVPETTIHMGWYDDL
jgi:hypothetical protein